MRRITIILTLMALTWATRSPATLIPLEAVRRLEAGANAQGRHNSVQLNGLGSFDRTIQGLSYASDTIVSQTSLIVETVGTPVDSVNYQGYIRRGFNGEALSLLTLDFETDSPNDPWAISWVFSESAPGIGRGYVELMDVETGDILLHVGPSLGIGQGSALGGPLDAFTRYRLTINQLEPTLEGERNDWTVTLVVPEPSAALLLGIGLASLAALRESSGFALMKPML